MCEITKEFVSALLAEESDLRSLNLSSNGLIRIDPSFSTLSNITALDLSQNDLAIGSWLHTLAALPNLRWLDLKGNPVCRHPESSLWLRSLLPQLQTLNGCTSTPAPDGSIAPGLPSSQDSPLPFLVPDHQQQKVLRTSVKDGSCDQQAAECTELRSQTARLQQPLCAVTALHGEGVQLAEQKSAWREHLRCVQEQCIAAQQIMQVLVHRLSQQHTRLKQAEAQTEAASAALAAQQHRADWLAAHVQCLEGRCQQLQESLLKSEQRMRGGRGNQRLGGVVGHAELQLPSMSPQASSETAAEPGTNFQGPLRSQVHHLEQAGKDLLARLCRDLESITTSSVQSLEHRLGHMQEQVAQALATTVSHKAAAAQELATSQAESAQLRQDLRAQAANLAQVQEEVKALHTHEAQLQVELSTACTRVAQMQDQVTGMHAHQAQLSHELDTARSHEAQLQNEVTELHAQKAQLQEEVLVLRMHEAQLQVELDSAVQAGRQDKQALEACREAEESARQQVSHLTSSLKEAERQTAKAHVQTKQLERQLGRLDSSRAGDQTEIEHLQQKLQAKEAALRGVQRERNSLLALLRGRGETPSTCLNGQGHTH